MSLRLSFSILILVLLTAPGEVYGQQSTEIFIPIGQSPGLSGRTTLGKVDAVEVERGTLTMTNDAGETYTVRIGEHTWIWLDRSGSGQTNTEGSLSDCRPGQRIEVYFGDADPEVGDAVWVKLEAS